MTQELAEAKQAVEDLEEELKEERARLRVLMTEQTDAERQREQITLQLRRTEIVSPSGVPGIVAVVLNLNVGHERDQRSFAED